MRLQVQRYKLKRSLELPLVILSDRWIPLLCIGPLFPIGFNLAREIQPIPPGNSQAASGKWGPLAKSFNFRRIQKRRRARSSRLLLFPSRGNPASLTEGD